MIISMNRIRACRLMTTWHLWLLIYTRGASDPSGGPGVGTGVNP
jgi:hypothetical protein